MPEIWKDRFVLGVPLLYTEDLRQQELLRKMERRLQETALPRPLPPARA